MLWWNIEQVRPLRKSDIQIFRIPQQKSGLAKQLGISRNAYHQMDAGKVYFNVLSFLQVTPEEFFCQL